MLVIEGNAVYEVDCGCLSRKYRYSPAAVRCNEEYMDRNSVKINLGRKCVEKDIYTGKGVAAAVLDTGIYSEHPDISGRVTGWYDAVDHSDIPFDPNGHGTQEGGKWDLMIK